MAPNAGSISEKAGQVRSGQAAASPNAAFVIRGAGCSMGPAGVTTDTHLVANVGGVLIFSCHTSAANPTGSTVIVRGELCTFDVLATTDMQFVWTPSGEATLTCRFRF